MLKENDRIKLDGIVKQMINNKEADSTIRLVVDDFKSKYDSVAPAKEDKNIVMKASDFVADTSKGFYGGISNIITDTTKGAAKGVLSTLTGISSISERALDSMGRIVTPKKYEKALGFEKTDKKSAELLIPEKYRSPNEDSTAEKIGFYGEQVAEWFIPWTKTAKVEKGVNALSKLTKTGKVVKNFAGEATETIARQASQTGEINKDTITTGIGVPIINKVISKSGILTKAGESLFGKLPEWLIKQAIPLKPKQIRAGVDVSKYALENKRFGTAQSLFDKSSTEINKLNSSINNKLLKESYAIGRPIPNTNLPLIFDDVAKKLNSDGADITGNEVKKIVINLAKQSKGLIGEKNLNIGNTNRLRQSLDKTLGDKGFLMSELPFNKEVLKNVTNALREKVKSSVPSTRSLFDRFTKEITIKEALSNKLSTKAGSQSINFTDLLIGAGTFAGTDDPFKAIAATGGRAFLRSAPLLTGVGITLNQLKKIGPVLEKLNPAENKILSDTIRSILSNSKE